MVGKKFISLTIATILLIIGCRIIDCRNNTQFIYNTQIKNIIYNVAGNKDILKHTYITDTKYIKLKRSDIVKIVNGIRRFKYKKEVCDCDDFHVILHGFVRFLQCDEQCDFPIAFGECIIEGNKTTHALNFAITSDDGFVFADKLNEDKWFVWKPKGEVILMVKM
uniref:Agglutinin C-terminal domain-containing protein n=1 Tax=viral metagenome TaxID=1070528 RepID=A0A6M3JYK4_9ZZZZ